MNAGVLQIPFGSEHRRRVVCYRGRRSKRLTPTVRLVARVTFIAVLVAAPLVLAVMFYVSHATGR